MANYLSRSLLAMAIFAAFSTALGWSVVSYSLFATGIATVVLTDHVKMKRPRRNRQTMGVIIAIPGLGMIGGPVPALVFILPIAAIGVFAADLPARVGSRSKESAGKRWDVRDDPLTNICVSLPSVVALLAIISLA